ncbi:MAG: hypothetical protein H7X93_04035 [Sphingomonadaceae bacterium]|nr:hypothetical protein [Sphingomonadaceae bacterium]
MRIVIFLVIAAVLIFIAARIAVFVVSLLIWGVAIALVLAAIFYAMRQFGPKPPG